MKKTMSEARYNDLVYLTLKKLYFEPMLGDGATPRECDIRICMQMGHRPLLQEAGIGAAILMPNEISGRSHERMLEIDTDEVFKEVVNYMEDHWMKCTTEEAAGNESIMTEYRRFFNEEIVPAIMKTAEEDCGVTYGPNQDNPGSAG